MIRWLEEPRNRRPRFFRPMTKGVHQHVQLLQQRPAVLPHLPGCQVLKQVPGVAPDVLLRKALPHLAHQVQHRPLVPGVAGLAPQEGQPLDVGFPQCLQHRVRRLLGEGVPIFKIPGLRVEALRASVGAAGHKDRDPDARPVGHVDGANIRVVHSSFTASQSFRRRRKEFKKVRRRIDCVAVGGFAALRIRRTPCGCFAAGHLDPWPRRPGPPFL